MDATDPLRGKGRDGQAACFYGGGDCVSPSGVLESRYSSASTGSAKDLWAPSGDVR